MGLDPEPDDEEYRDVFSSYLNRWSTRERGTAKYDLVMDVMEEPGGELRGVMEYSRDLFDESTIQGMLGHFNWMLGELLISPDRPITQIIGPGATHHDRRPSHAYRFPAVWQQHPASTWWRAPDRVL